MMNLFQVIEEDPEVLEEEAPAVEEEAPVEEVYSLLLSFALYLILVS